jgi:hypothetical protein
MSQLKVLHCLWIVVPSLAMAGSANLAAADEPAARQPIAAAEARNHVGEKGTFAMTVQSTKNASPRREYYLDSEEDFRDEKNLALVISYDHADLFQQAGIDDPSEYYKGKKIHVTGMVIHENDQVRIRVEDPKQIKVVDENGTH